jgi:hypothetical protein
MPEWEKLTNSKYGHRSRIKKCDKCGRELTMDDVVWSHHRPHGETFVTSEEYPYRIERRIKTKHFCENCYNGLWID